MRVLQIFIWCAHWDTGCGNENKMKPNNYHSCFFFGFFFLPHSTVFCMVAACSAIPINDLLDRASQRSDLMHSLSTSLTQDLVSMWSRACTRVCACVCIVSRCLTYMLILLFSCALSSWLPQVWLAWGAWNTFSCTHCSGNTFSREAKIN